MTFLDRDPIDVLAARRQHAAYVSALEAAGVVVTVAVLERGRV